MTEITVEIPETEPEPEPAPIVIVEAPPDAPGAPVEAVIDHAERLARLEEAIQRMQESLATLSVRQDIQEQEIIQEPYPELAPEPEVIEVEEAPTAPETQEEERSERRRPGWGNRLR